MIDENYILSDSEMNAKLKKVEQFLESKFIFCTKNWLQEKIEIHKKASKLEDKIFEEVIMSDLSKIIDKNKVAAHCNLSENFIFENKQKIMKTNLFLQIMGYSNIAEPSEKNDKNGENLDVLENFESKYLQSEGEENKKAEKVILKFQFSDGIDSVVGFEYENLKDLKTKLNNMANEVKYPKVLLGPTYEVRRGIIYLKNNNITLL